MKIIHLLIILLIIVLVYFFYRPYILETFGGIKEVKFYSRENYFLNLLFKLNDRNTYYQTRINFFQQLPRIYLELLTIVCLTGLILFEVFQGNSLLNLIPQLTVFLAASFRVIPSANKILSQLQVIKVCNASIELIHNDFFNLDYQVLKTETSPFPSQVNDFRTLELKNIFFRYDISQEDILKNLNDGTVAISTEDIFRRDSLFTNFEDTRPRNLDEIINVNNGGAFVIESSNPNTFNYREFFFIDLRFKKWLERFFFLFCKFGRKFVCFSDEFV